MRRGLHLLLCQPLWLVIMTFTTMNPHMFAEASPHRIEGDASITKEPQKSSFTKRESTSTVLAGDQNYFKRGNLCQALEDPGSIGGVFCQCSDSKTYPIMTQVPTPGLAFDPCGYTTIPSGITTHRPIISSSGDLKRSSQSWNFSSSLSFPRTNTKPTSLPTVIMDFPKNQSSTPTRLNSVSETINRPSYTTELSVSNTPYSTLNALNGFATRVSRPRSESPQITTSQRSTSKPQTPPSHTPLFGVSSRLVGSNTTFKPLASGPSTISRSYVFTTSLPSNRTYSLSGTSAKRSQSSLPPRISTTSMLVRGSSRPMPIVNILQATRLNQTGSSNSSWLHNFDALEDAAIKVKSFSSSASILRTSSRETPSLMTISSVSTMPPPKDISRSIAVPSISSAKNSSNILISSIGDGTASIGYASSTTNTSTYAPLTAMSQSASLQTASSKTTEEFLLSSSYSTDPNMASEMSRTATAKTTLASNPFTLSFVLSSSSAMSADQSQSLTSSTASAQLSNSILPSTTSKSSSSQLSTVACPSAYPSEVTKRMLREDPILACDPDARTLAQNESSTTNSSQPSVQLTDPDGNGNYSDPNASSSQLKDCLNPAAGQRQECWDVLNVTGYVTDWTAFNKKACEEESMDFADCFTYLEVGAGANCTAFTGRSQCPSPDPRSFNGHRNGAQAFYVAFNIWNIQNWFFSYYLALGTANTLGAENVNNICATLNVPVPKGFPLMDFLAGLAYAFGLLSPSGYGALLPKLGEKVSGLGAQAPGEYLLRSIQNSPTLARNMLDTGEMSETEIQATELSSDLARVVSQLQSNVQSAIGTVLNNFTLFLSFVEDGYFSTQIENLNTLAQNVTLALNTYLVSQSLQNQNVIITRALNTDINQLQQNGSAIGYDTGCGHGYNQFGVCGNWWYDSVNRISYGLESQKDMVLNFTGPLMSLFSQGITTPQLLFMNSQICADAAGSNQGNAPGTELSRSTGLWNTECISNMKICTWNTVDLSVDKEFTDCPHEEAFAMEGCGMPADQNQALVPISYIGQWLTSGSFQGIVCNKLPKGSQNPG